MRTRNPFPGVGNKPAIDRHGQKRWRLRKTIKGRKIDVYLTGPYGSAEFRADYDAAINPPAMAPASGAIPGTFDHVIIHYLGSKGFKSLSASTRKPKRRRLDAIRVLIGPARMSDLEPHHVENLMDRKGGPEAPNRLHKELGELYRYAQKSWATTDRIRMSESSVTRSTPPAFTRGPLKRSSNTANIMHPAHWRGWRLK